VLDFQSVSDFYKIRKELPQPKHGNDDQAHDEKGWDSVQMCQIERKEER
jgi:hypothetical protein